MLQIPIDRRPLNPSLLCALMAVTALLFWSMAHNPAHQVGAAPAQASQSN